MNGEYGGNVLPTRAIYPPKSTVLYLGLLGVSKFFKAFGLFMAYDLLKLIHVVQFLCLMKAGASIPLVFLQKPFSSSKKITKNQWFRIIRHAVIGTVISLLWLFGLTLCGALRTILLFEHADIIILTAASALFSSKGGPAKSRGAVFLLTGVVSLLLFDHDDKLHHQDPDVKHSSFMSHIFQHTVGFFGWSDHKGGVILLFLTLCLQSGYNSASRHLSVDVGGAKRLHALSTMISSIILMPWAFFIYLTRESEIESWTSLIVPLFIIIMALFVLDFYVDAISLNHLNPQGVAKYGAYAIFLGAFLLVLVWDHPLVLRVSSMHKVQEIITEDHVLSGGVFFTLVAFMVATHILVSPSRTTKGSFIGYSAGGVPLYTFTGDVLQRTSHSVMSVLKGGLKQILEESDSRKIFYFLCINLAFTFVELIYGVWTNSLGLISDGFHMLFDCSALVMGLYAAVMSRWKATRIFSYGFDRVEVLSGFINGLFLIVIAFFVFTTALSRLVEPPEINTDRLLTVSVIGLCVNLFGIMAFRGFHGHSHGGGGHSHGSHGGGHQHSQSSHGSGHQHGHQGHGHSHAQPASDCGSHNANMEGVFLHVLADTLGSVGVIISSILIEHFGWNIADPICSLFIALLIFVSVFPLLRETANILLLRTPLHKENDVSMIIEKIVGIEGVVSYTNPHFWHHTSSKCFGTLHVQVTADASEQKIIAQISSLSKEAGIDNLEVQVEKQAYFQHLSGLTTNFDQMMEHNKHSNLLTFDEAQQVIIKAV